MVDKSLFLILVQLIYHTLGAKKTVNPYDKNIDYAIFDLLPNLCCIYSDSRKTEKRMSKQIFFAKSILKQLLTQFMHNRGSTFSKCLLHLHILRPYDTNDNRN